MFRCFPNPSKLVWNASGRARERPATLNNYNMFGFIHFIYIYIYIVALSLDLHVFFYVRSKQIQFQLLPSPSQVAPVASGPRPAVPLLTPAPSRPPLGGSGQPTTGCLWLPEPPARHGWLSLGPGRLALAGWRMGVLLGSILGSICASALGVKILYFHRI